MKILEMLKNLRKLDGRTVSAGIQEDAPNYPDGTSTVLVGMTKEYGTINEPARPFMRNTLADNAEKYSEMSAKAVRKILKFRRTKALDTLGEEMVEDMKRTIDTMTSPRLAPSTVSKKGNAVLLRDTDHMYDNITYRIEDEEDVD